ncbi:hypothetical protein H1235_14350 [Pseudoxanthomonas sp. NC8]|nr:hypothetical protein H1235_14350 [Pseudoxanthomonas sp. NC8]
MPACLSACLLAALPEQAQAQPVQRCTGPDGRAVYTDRRCDAVGAVDRLSPAGSAAQPRLYRDGCPRLLSQLVGEIGAAIQARDVNRLAGIYDWSGVSSTAASRLLDRLEGVVERPLVDIAPVYAEDAPAAAPAAGADLPPPPAAAAAPTATAGDPASWMPSWRIAQPSAAPVAATAPGVEAAPDAPPAPTYARARPIALRIEQTLAGSATPARTVFGLRRSYGCFWITL